MNYAEFKALRQPIEAAVERTGKAMSSFPSLPNGLTPDAVKFTPEWKAAREAFGNTVQSLKAFDNHFRRLYGKTWPVFFKKEIAAETKARRAAQLAARNADNAE